MKNHIDMIKISPFQDFIARELIIWLFSRGLTSSMTVEGHSESYLLCKVGNLQFYIYSDGYDILGPDINERFEKEDFPSEDWGMQNFCNVISQIFDRDSSLFTK